MRKRQIQYGVSRAILDDCSGEVLGFVMDELFAAGARDVYYTPIYMKKNRPAVQINIICREQDVDKLQNILFCNTTTIGVRRCRMERTILPREIRQMEYPLWKSTGKGMPDRRRSPSVSGI